MVEAGGVEPPSEDSLLRATTCVSGRFVLVLKDPGRQGSLRTIPAWISPFLPPGGGFKAIPLGRRPSAYTGNRRSDVRGFFKPRRRSYSRWRLLVPAFNEVRGASARNPGASTSPSKPFRPRRFKIPCFPGQGKPPSEAPNRPAFPHDSGRRRVRPPSGRARTGPGTVRTRSAGSRTVSPAPRCPRHTRPR